MASTSLPTWPVVEVKVFWGDVEHIPVAIVWHQDVTGRELHCFLDGAAFFIFGKRHCMLELKKVTCV